MLAEALPRGTVGHMANVHITPEIIREIRIRLGLNQTEAGKRCRVSRRTWLDWENGHKKPDGPASLVLEGLYAEANSPTATA